MTDELKKKMEELADGKWYSGTFKEGFQSCHDLMKKDYVPRTDFQMLINLAKNLTKELEARGYTGLASIYKKDIEERCK